jgi:hypothetical protein
MLLGRAPIGVQFSGHAHENQRYANKRAEMYFDAVNWIKRGGALPPDDNLLAQLTATTYTYEKRGDRFLIEPKEMVKAKLNGNSPDEADAFCFVGNTLIATPNGDIRIRVIEEGDEVLTPLGVARVTKKWVTSVERLATVDFSNGEHLIGRPEHKVFAYKAGVIDLNALSLTMAVSPLSERQKWLNASELFTAIRSIGFKTAVGILAHEIPSTARGCCIAVSGQNVMDRFRTVLKSTTRIAIGAIARSTILNFSQRPITTPCTQPNAASLRNGRNEKTDISSWRQKRQSGGTQVPKDWSGIQKTALRVGKTENQPAALASDAEAPFGHTTQLEPSIAQKVARWLTPFGAILRTFGRAIGAARRLQQIVIGKQPVVPVSVQTENVLPTTVYNLTLDRDNAYYANGILVFNCLTFAEPVTAQDAKGRPRFTAEYNPFDGVNKSTASSSRHTSEYDPYRIF